VSTASPVTTGDCRGALPDWLKLAGPGLLPLWMVPIPATVVLVLMSRRKAHTLLIVGGLETLGTAAPWGQCTASRVADQRVYVSR
jgi:hypothetical protein